MDHAVGLISLLLQAGLALVIIATIAIVWSVLYPPRRTMAYALAGGMHVDPGEAGRAFTSWEVSLSGGGLMPVWEIETDGRESDPVLVVAHGWGRSRIDELARLPVWAAGARKVVLYDLRGHGESERTTSRLGVGEEEDLCLLLERLAPAAVVLAGCSLGSVVVLRTASRIMPEGIQLRGIIGIGTWDRLSSVLASRLRSRGLPAWPCAQVSSWVLRLLGVPAHVLQDTMPRLDVPVLLLHGSEDLAAPLEELHELGAGNAKITVKVIEEGGHSLREHGEQDACRESVLHFLDQLQGT